MSLTIRHLPSPLPLHRTILLLCGVLSAPAAALAQPRPQQDVSFNREVRPLLADRCFHCHGPDQGNRKAKLRLDRADGPHGAYRARLGVAAIKPGSADNSAVWYRLTTGKPKDRMPPVKSHKKPLSADERELIRRWIEQGAKYEDHWAFVAPVAPALPRVADDGWSHQAIDRFVLRRLESVGRRPNPRADRRTLIRRVSFDLTGLPPTPGEIRAFLSDRAAGAYQRLVDRLLARPQYGEHMARYWLDLVRFADTNGVHHDHYRDMSRYRDWVIRAFNANLGYDEFVTDQLAGDLHRPATDEQKIASGFNRLHMIIDRGTALPQESFTRNVIDRVTAVGTAFMGLTVQCAVCHDHKYDPIKQADFYRLYAFFNNLNGKPETGGRNGADFKRGLQRPYISFPTERQRRTVEDLECELVAARNQVEDMQIRIDEFAREISDEIIDEVLRKLRQRLKVKRAEIKRLARKQTDILLRVPAAMVMQERWQVRPAHILVRGAYDNPGPQVERGTPAFLPAMPTGSGVKTRLDLARWLVAPSHPLTARVAVNRLWQQLFGVGIVKTAADFGTQGEWPSHPELLDHLAASFVQTGWDVKALVKRIVMSATYRQSSRATPAAFAEDPQNRLLARGSRFRLDAEMIRDQILATSGRLDPTMFGKSVKPPQPAGIWKAVTLPSSYPRTYTADTGTAIYRRSLYTFWKRGMPPPQMSILNAPTREFCTASRERTNTPLQALLLLNEQEYLDAARHLAATTLARGAQPAPQRLAALFETITSRLPDAVESATMLRSLGELRAMYQSDPALAARLCKGVELGDLEAPELAAWTVLISSIYNLDITKTRS